MNRGIMCMRVAMLAAIFCGSSLTCFNQVKESELKRFVDGGYYNNNSSFQFSNEIKAFYSNLNYNVAWIGKNEDTINRNCLLAALRSSANVGLNEKDYQYNYIESLKTGKASLKNANDSIEADVRLTEAAIHFYSDISYGNVTPEFGYNGLNYKSACRDIPYLLTSRIQTNQLKTLISSLSISLPEVAAISAKIQRLNIIAGDDNFNEVYITSAKATVENTPFILKLYQLGIIDSINSVVTDKSLKQKIKAAQVLFNLMDDGVLRSTLLQELNVPVSLRLLQLNRAINYYRWLYCLARQQEVIVVNIPAANLKVYHEDSVTLQMRIIVGKRSTPTPTLSSSVNNVILYPYWHVPYSIATNEMLPLLKQNAGYIDAGNYQVLNKAGEIMNPYAVNWKTLSASYFPYLIRQSTGCDNALGLLKLDFYNPFGVYLHDTPNKGLFTLNKRYFSHGCMRMEKPMEMGHLVLQNKAVAIDTLEQKGCLRNQAPVSVPASKHLPVVVWYNLVGIDEVGRVIFYEDVYRKFRVEQD